MTEATPPAGEASGGAAGADWDAADPAAPEGEAAKEGDKEQEAAAEQPAEPVAPPTPVEEEKVNPHSLDDRGRARSHCCCGCMGNVEQGEHGLMFHHSRLGGNQGLHVGGLHVTYVTGESVEAWWLTQILMLGQWQACGRLQQSLLPVAIEGMRIGSLEHCAAPHRGQIWTYRFNYLLCLASEVSEPGTQTPQAALTATRGVQPQMTLDEWEKIQKEKRAARAKEGRQPKEITNKEDFSGMQEFTRKDRTADTNVLNVTQKQLSARKAGTNERERKTAVSACPCRLVQTCACLCLHKLCLRAAGLSWLPVHQHDEPNADITRALAAMAAHAALASQLRPLHHGLMHVRGVDPSLLNLGNLAALHCWLEPHQAMQSPDWWGAAAEGGGGDWLPDQR